MKHNPIQKVLQEVGLAHWLAVIDAQLKRRLSPQGHGDWARWQDAIDALPESSHTQLDLNGDRVTAAISVDEDALRQHLGTLKPWRKGPFQLGNVHLDTEWRSDMKWARIADAIANLNGRRVLDVGAGNGYFGFRMLGAGAQNVLGIDPTLLFVAQFAALSKYIVNDQHALLPFRLEELPAGEQSFDTVFSMGVLYHQRSPIDHLRLLRQHLAENGELVLETLILPGDDAFARTPADRYARMRNVWMLPSIAELEIWLARSGYRDSRVIDVSRTTTDEQRPTEWMEFESLAHALDSDDSSKTVEGWPAPMRATLLAH